MNNKGIHSKRKNFFKSLIWISICLVGVLFWACESKIAGDQKIVEAWIQPHGPRPTKPLAFAASCIDRYGFLYITVSDRDATAFIMKYDPAGQRLWFTRDEFLPSALAVDNLGYVYAAGSVLDENDGYSGSMVVKYKDSGEKIWTAASDRYQQGIDRVFSLTVDGRGNVYVTGISLYRHTSYIVIKYDKAGIQQWRFKRNVPGQEMVNIASAVDGEGSVYVTGSHGTFKIDRNGKLLWAAKVSGSAVLLDRHVAVYISGYNDSPSGYRTTKFDPKGNQIWKDTYPTEKATLRLQMAMDTQGGVFICGYLVTLKYDENGSRIFEKPGGRYLAIDPEGNIYVAIDHNYCTTKKYDGLGREIWETHFKKPKVDYNWPYALTADSKGNIYLTLIHEKLYKTIKYTQ